MILHVPFLTMRQIIHYANAALPNEVTGIGMIKQLTPNDFLVTGIILPHQKVNPGYSEFDDEELNNIITDVITDQPEQAVDLRFRWHSHGHSQTFWSGTDNADIAKWQASWAVNLVVNAVGDVLARFDMFKPFSIVDYPMRVVIDYDADSELEKKCYREVAEKVKPFPQKPNGILFDPRKISQEDEPHV